MPSPSYTSLLRLVSAYVDSPKDAEVIARQLAALKMDPETLTTNDLKALESRIGCACGLYITDPAKRDEFKARVRTLA